MKKYILFLYVVCICCLPITACESFGQSKTDLESSSFALTDIPEYDGEPYVDRKSVV